MRLSELSERSGVSIATIKYYLREGLLAPGRRVSATTADYDESHLRRLRLVRALIQSGMPTTSPWAGRSGWAPPCGRCRRSPSRTSGTRPSAPRAARWTGSWSRWAGRPPGN
jgi:hypothetical protein